MRSVLRQSSRLLQETNLHHTSIPIFLCPALLGSPTIPTFRPKTRPDRVRTFHCTVRRKQQVAATPSDAPLDHVISSVPTERKRDLPVSCPGCGAPSQTIQRDEAGYYALDRKAVKTYLNLDGNQDKVADDSVYKTALQHLEPEVLKELGLDKKTPSPTSDAPPSSPICDRCHNLVNYHTGVPILHPSIAAIKETIAESPHRRNHIYHVIDAADFPMSLIPNLQSALKLPQLRTQNRRSKHRNWVSGDRIAEVSFIITRSDLLAPLKEQVDKLMPYVQQTLRGALGRANKNVRLGNVRMVSAKRGWWTKEVKEDVWERGGGGWMVGKVNVGKSNLFETVFPKGRGGSQDVNVRKMRSAVERKQMQAAARSLEELVQVQQQLAQEDAEIARAEIQRDQSSPTVVASRPSIEEALDPDLENLTLLPPAQPETPYPTMPLISSLPGTTASPIRIPFGNKRGELIDLPGIERTNPPLDSFVKPEYRASLVMATRVTPEKQIIKPKQSLLLGGGLIRITPKTDDLVFIAHPFVPLEPHTTSLEKAAGIQSQTRDSGVKTILADGVGEKIKSAGTVQLKWDVTRKLAGPLTNPKAGKLKPENLPFTIYSADVLIEGVGWVELVAQVRKPKNKPSLSPADSSAGSQFHLLSPQPSDAFPEVDSTPDAFDRADVFPSESMFPEVEIFTPEGKFIGVRQPMSASLLGGPKPKARNERKARPRVSMKSLKFSQRGRVRTGEMSAEKAGRGFLKRS